jgi:hypothetical protein
MWAHLRAAKGVIHDLADLIGTLGGKEHLKADACGTEFTGNSDDISGLCTRTRQWFAAFQVTEGCDAERERGRR